jgi:hypothetical protein
MDHWYVNQWIDCYFNHHRNRLRADYANTATISAAEADQHQKQQCYGNTRTRSTNQCWNHQEPVNNNATPNVGSNVIFTLTANAGTSYNRIGW